MKPFCIILTSIFLAFSAHAQTTIKLQDVSKHIGDSVTVCGEVDDMRYFENSKNQPTFLNIGGKYPQQLLTVVVWGEVRKLFNGDLDNMKKKIICITGRIILYKERPEIIITSPAQIEIQ